MKCSKRWAAAKPMTGMMLAVGALFLCGLGLIAPRAVLDNRIAARKTQLEQEFPDALDLMVVCVEAGLGLESALVRVAVILGRVFPKRRDLRAQRRLVGRGAGVWFER